MRTSLSLDYSIESVRISYCIACKKADKKTRLNYCGKKERRYHSNSLAVIKVQKQ